MKNSIFYKVLFFLIPIGLVLISLFFLFATVNASVSKKYEVFNPKAAYYYSTLKSESAKTKYIDEVEHHNFIVKASVIVYFILTILSFVSAILLFRKAIRNTKEIQQT